MDGQQELSIIKLAEPLLLAIESETARDTTRASDVSSTVQPDVPTPASLEADLAHYKELFTKLRFSYVEQVTKEKFLRAVVGDPPLYISANENAKLESHLLSVKASLKAQKTEVDEIIAQLEQQGRVLSHRYQAIQLQSQRLQDLPEQIEGLQMTIKELKYQQAPKSDNPLLSMPLPRTLEILSEKENESAMLDIELARLRGQAEKQNRDLEQLQKELGPLQAQKAQASKDVIVAKQRKEQGMGGIGDDLEARGRWLRGTETALRSMLEVEA